MIEFLKESTFAVKDVLNISSSILKRHYFSILGLCLSMFLISFLSGLMANFLNQFNFFLSLLMAVFFLLLYFGLQLTLFKFTFRVLDYKDENIGIKVAIPTIKEVTYFFTGTLYFVLCILSIYMLVSILLLPLIYMHINSHKVAQIAVFIGTIIAMIIWIRISFFPFFIIDRHLEPNKALRLSLAITRGNFTRILLLLGFFALFNLIYLYFNYKEYYMLSGMATLANSFLIAPLSAVSLVVAYRKMMVEYKGEEDPDIIHHII